MEYGFNGDQGFNKGNPSSNLEKSFSEPILYDPIKQSSNMLNAQSAFTKKNVAKPGSLLRVWEGSLSIYPN